MSLILLSPQKFLMLDVVLFFLIVEGRYIHLPWLIPKGSRSTTLHGIVSRFHNMSLNISTMTQGHEPKSSQLGR